MKWSRLFLLLPLMVSGPLAVAQATVKVTVLDGRTGKPIDDARMSLSVVHDYAARTLTATVLQNPYLFQVHRGDTLVLESLTKSKFSWNEYRLCAAGEDIKPIYAVDTILSKGMQSPNECNRRLVAKPNPGEMVFFVTRLSFWGRYRPFTD
jgi:hypothetical protein